MIWSYSVGIYTMLTGGKYTESNKLSGMCYQRETCKRWFFLLVFTFTSVSLAQNCYTWGLFESHIIGCKLRSIFVLMVIGNHGIILGYVSLLFSLDAFVIYCDIVLCISYVIVLWRFPFVNLQLVLVGFNEKTAVRGSVSVFTVPDFNHVQSKH